jgi:fatty acid desaturase
LTPNKPRDYTRLNQSEKVMMMDPEVLKWLCIGLALFLVTRIWFWSLVVWALVIGFVVALFTFHIVLAIMLLLAAIILSVIVNGASNA